MRLVEACKIKYYKTFEENQLNKKKINHSEKQKTYMGLSIVSREV